MSTMPDKRQRRPRARHRDVIFGSIEERLLMLESLCGGLAENQEVLMTSNIERLRELIAELSRSLGGSKESEE